MGESFLERLFELLILKARFGRDNAGRPHRSAPFGGWGWLLALVGLGLLLRLKGRSDV